MAGAGEILAFLNQMFPMWVAAPRPIRWLLAIWGCTSVAIVGWIIVTFKLQPFMELWSAAPRYLKLILMLWVIVTVPIGGWWLVWLSRRQTRTFRIRARRILDDFTQFLNQQIPGHEKNIEAVTIRISAHFPASVGPQGAENRAQIEAACERRREIRNRWQTAQRGIEDLAIEAGLDGVADRAIRKQISEIGKRVAHTLELVRETTRNRCFKTAPAGAFDQAWAVVCPVNS